MNPNPYDKDYWFSPRYLMIGGGLVKETKKGKVKVNEPLYHQWKYRMIFTACEDADGPGTISRYSYEDVLVVALVVRLRQFYIPLKKAGSLARDIVKIMSEWWPDHDEDDIWPEITIVICDKKGLRVEVKKARTSSRDALHIDVETICNNVNGRLEEC